MKILKYDVQFSYRLHIVFIKRGKSVIDVVEKQRLRLKNGKNKEFNAKDMHIKFQLNKPFSNCTSKLLILSLKVVN